MAHMEVALKDLMMLDGAIAAAVVDHGSGMPLGTAGGSRDFDIDLAAAGTTEIVRAKMRTIGDLGLNEEIDDILITLRTQFHLLRPTGNGLFVYVVLDRGRGNLALARHSLAAVTRELEV
nr:hypothetical protein [Nocardia harenae]